jgi:hypothetical protein
MIIEEFYCDLMIMFEAHYGPVPMTNNPQQPIVPPHVNPSTPSNIPSINQEPFFIPVSTTGTPSKE